MNVNMFSTLLSDHPKRSVYYYNYMYLRAHTQDPPSEVLSFGSPKLQTVKYPFSPPPHHLISGATSSSATLTTYVCCCQKKSSEQSMCIASRESRIHVLRNHTKKLLGDLCPLKPILILKQSGQVCSTFRLLYLSIGYIQEGGIWVAMRSQQNRIRIWAKHRGWLGQRARLGGLRGSSSRHCCGWSEAEKENPLLTLFYKASRLWVTSTGSMLWHC